MYKVLMILYFLCIYVVPSSVLLRPEYLFSSVLTFIAIFTCYKNCVEINSRELLLLMLLSFSAVLSVFFQNLIGAELIYQDLMILVRYVYYIFAIIAGGYFAYKIKNYNNLKHFVFIIVIASSLISIFQYHNLFSINTIMSAYISEKSEALVIGYYWRRIIGTYGNPNYWGLFLNACMIISMYFVVFKKQYLWLVPIVLIFISIIYTGSRTTLVSLFASSLALFYIVQKYKVERISKNILLAVMLLSVIGVGSKLFLSNDQSEIYSGKDRFSTDNITTLEMRIYHWRKMISHTFNHPIRVIIGGGESKGRASVFGDNMYLKYFRDYGFIGFSLYLILLITMYRSILKIVINNSQIRHISIPYLWMFICFIIFDLAADSWFVVRIAGLLLFFYGFLKVADHLNKPEEVKPDDGKCFNNNTELEWRGPRLR